MNNNWKTRAIKWKQASKNLCTGWLFQMSCQIPQFTEKQNFYNHFHIKTEKYDFFSRHGRRQHKRDSKFLINANFLCNNNPVTTTLLWNTIRGYTLYYLSEDGI
jgi:hypothetical protein